MSTSSIVTSPAWKSLVAHAPKVSKQHLRDLLKDGKRATALTIEHDGIVLDSSRQNATAETKKLLIALANAADLPKKLKAMASGAKLNTTENRSVLHMALRADAKSKIVVDGQDVVQHVSQHQVAIARPDVAERHVGEIPELA